MRIFRRTGCERADGHLGKTDTPIWDDLMAEHNRSGTAFDLTADVESSLRPETRAWLRHHGQQLANAKAFDGNALQKPGSETAPEPEPEVRA